jgi:hypothetical protein
MCKILQGSNLTIIPWARSSSSVRNYSGLQVRVQSNLPTRMTPYMLIFRRIFLSNYWWQKSDIWSQASYRYPISWEAFFDPSDSYFLFAKEWGYHRWALAHSSSCSMGKILQGSNLTIASWARSIQGSYPTIASWVRSSREQSNH